MLNNIKSIHKTIEKVGITLSRLMTMYDFADENKAFVMLRASLKALRDRLSPEEAIHLGSQLPALLRGFYFEGWNLKHQSTSRTREAFIEEVRTHLNGHEDIDLDEALPVTLETALLKW